MTTQQTCDENCIIQSKSCTNGFDFGGTCCIRAVDKSCVSSCGNTWGGFAVDLGRDTPINQFSLKSHYASAYLTDSAGNKIAGTDMTNTCGNDCYAESGKFPEFSTRIVYVRAVQLAANTLELYIRGFKVFDATCQNKCPVGEACSADAPSCQICQEGKYQPNNDVFTFGCLPWKTCASGEGQVDGDNTKDAQCSACGPGLYSMGNIPCQAWRTCSSGFGRIDGTATTDAACAACLAGMFQEDEQATVSCKPWTKCEAGEGRTDGTAAAQATCNPCSDGKFQPSAAGTTACAPWTTCNAGFGQIGGNPTIDCTCTACATGSYQNENAAATNCKLWEKCKKGQGRADGSALVDAKCSACDTGKFQSVSDATQPCLDWKTCSAGSGRTDGSATSDASCVGCEYGKYQSSSEGKTKCALWTPCDAGRGSTDGSATSDSSCYSCPTGQYQAENAAAAAACQAWRTCNKGSGRQEGSPLADATCVPCLVGMYQPSNDMVDECLPWRMCGRGKGQSKGSAIRDASCLKCQAGFYQPNRDVRSPCIRWQSCQAGSGHANGTRTQDANCLPCVVGKYQSENSCDQSCRSWRTCNKGSGRTGGSSVKNPDCTQCPGGFYQSEMASVSGCKPWTTCPAGSGYIKAGSSGEDSSCVLCSRGKYQPEFDGKTVCKNCKVGKFGPASGATEENDCENCPGQEYSNSEGSIECKICVKGKFSGEGSTSCSDTAPWVIPVSSVLLSLAVIGGLISWRWFALKKQKHNQVLELGESLLQSTQKSHDTETTERLLGWLIQPDEVSYEVVIGSGAFGEVWRGQWKGVDVAIKKIYQSLDDFASYSDIVTDEDTSSISTSSLTTSSASRSFTRMDNIRSKEDQGINQLTLDMLTNLEVDVMMKLRHPRIVAFVGAGEVVDAIREGETEPRRGVFVVLEYVPGGDLTNALQRAHKDPASFPWSARLQAATDIAEGMVFIHSKHLLHRDLKSLNVLVDFDGRCKIADLGLVRKHSEKKHKKKKKKKKSKWKRKRKKKKTKEKNKGQKSATPWDDEDEDEDEEDMYMFDEDVDHFMVDMKGGTTVMPAATAMQGTVQWMAPECFKSEGYGTPVDVYSFGVVMWELISCYIPWSHDENFAFMHKIMIAVKLGQRPPLSEDELVYVPPEFVDLMQECWDMSPGKRPSFEEILERMRSMTARSLTQNLGLKEISRLRSEMNSLEEEMQQLANAFDYRGADRIKKKHTALKKRMMRMDQSTHAQAALSQTSEGVEVKIDMLPPPPPPPAVSGIRGAPTPHHNNNTNSALMRLLANN
jgi:serine/threonine protein kinase